MKVSIIMQSYLGLFPNCAKDRENKFRRAVNSVLEQTHKDFELIIIADGCMATRNILINEFHDNRIKWWRLEKQTLWSNTLRNFGITKAEGELICYLDTDDYFEPNHLETLVNNIEDYNWIWFNDKTFLTGELKDRDCLISVKGQCGTSNIAHRNTLNAYWNQDASKENYLHDYHFIVKLTKLSNYFKYIKNSGYVVAHIPTKYDL